ncbi:MAG: ral secretion pathway protein [Alphaproteobacteria bacterium]|jgi:general secretion pathway protein L|nr:ral secretion pathway protein [Alphaproteobacteria bacterium]
MTMLRDTADSFSRWLDSVAVTLAGFLARFSSSSRTVQLVEGDGDVFTVRMPGQGAPAESVRMVNGQVSGSVSARLAGMLQGSRAELILKPARFLFRPLELPQRAAEFLDGIVRAQIDRLTPWNAADAVFGWSKPAEISNNRIVVTVAATARALIQPYLQTLTKLGAESVSISATPPDAGAGSAPITLLVQSAKHPLEVHRIRRWLLAVLVGTGLMGAAAVGAAVIVTDNLGSRQDELSRRLAERRVQIQAGRAVATGEGAPLRALERRKHEVPSSVIVLDALSRLLPDHTYVTEWRVEGDKLQVIGVTRDASSLIRLIEESGHFTRATFFAPTTRSPNDPGERFHIEARIQPVYTPGT